MTKPRISQALLWLLIAVTVVLFGFFIALVVGAIPIDDPRSPADSGVLRDASADEPDATTSTAVTERVSGVAPVGTTSTVVITAARGDSWFSARIGSEDGRLLDERLLAQGESVRLRAVRIWLSIGAAANVDVTVNGKERTLDSSTVSVVLGTR
jgi:hypothetical protein